MNRVPYPILVGTIAVFAGGIALGALAAPYIAPIPKDLSAKPVDFATEIRPVRTTANEMWIEPAPEDVTAMLPPVNLSDEDFAIWQYPEPNYESWEPEGFSNEVVTGGTSLDSDELAEDVQAVDVRKSELTGEGLY